MINENTKVHMQVYDDEHEEFETKEMTIREILDAYTDEGCPEEERGTAKMQVGKSTGGITFWYGCDKCGEPVDQQDKFCRYCGRKFIK